MLNPLGIGIVAAGSLRLCQIAISERGHLASYGIPQLDPDTAQAGLGTGSLRVGLIPHAIGVDIFELEAVDRTGDEHVAEDQIARRSILAVSQRLRELQNALVDGHRLLGGIDDTVVVEIARPVIAPVAHWNS